MRKINLSEFPIVSTQRLISHNATSAMYTTEISWRKVHIYHESDSTRVPRAAVTGDMSIDAGTREIW